MGGFALACCNRSSGCGDDPLKSTEQHLPLKIQGMTACLHTRWMSPSQLGLIFFLVLSSISTVAHSTDQTGKTNNKTNNDKPSATSYAKHPAVQLFAQDVAMRRDLDPEWVQNTLSQARKLPQVQRWILPPTQHSAKNWAAYRARFIEPIRLKAGLAFWNNHRIWLEKAELETGVPASIIVGILGVETLYGRYMGDIRVIDALMTLTFDFPNSHPHAAARTEYFRGELEQFLSLAQRTGIDPLQVRGSFAGAMGMGQFMPSSWVKYAVDFDGDGKVDLWNSPADAIGSVAHYLKGYGWKKDLPTHYAVGFDPSRLQLEALLAPDILPSFGVARAQSLGLVLPEAAKQHPGLLALIQLHNGDPARGGKPPSYVLGTENFYVVTRYNWSSYYALAVIELGETVAAMRRNEPPPESLAQ
jgi:membrane-bound lytic murein transglycosylase B